MKDREPKQWHELLQIISEAKRDLEKAIAAEKATGQRDSSRQQKAP